MGKLAAPAIPRLKEVLADPVGRVRLEAALALVAIDPGQAAPGVPVLLTALAEGKEGVNPDVVRALERIGPAASRAVPELRRLLEGKNRFLRLGAARALVKVDPAQTRVVLDVLAGALQEGKFPDRQVLKFLAELGPAARPILPALKARLEKLGPDNDYMKAEMIKTIVKIDRSQAKPLLARTQAELESADENLFHNALEALGELAPEVPEEAVPLLVAQLDKGKPMQRRINVVWALRDLGPLAKGALPALQAMQAGGDRNLQKAVQEALRRIDQPAAVGKTK
jgi:HEAT repeat protein